MAHEHFFSSVPELARNNRNMLWARSTGIWLGLAIAAFIFTDAIAINIPYLGTVLEGILAWGGIVWAVLSLVSIVYTLYRLHIDQIVETALKEDRAARRHRTALAHEREADQV